jgi:Polyketide cyclase / dehydrase and lipid transport
MATLRREIRINASADVVWKVVGRPEILYLWFPGIISSTVDGNTRVITTGTGIPMPEEIITNDSLQHRFQYRITSPLFRSHLATVDVLDVGDGTCMVVYSTEADPAVMALVIGGATTGALEELKRQFDAGVGPALAAAGIVGSERNNTEVNA